MKDSSLRAGTLANGFRYFLLQTDDEGLSIRLTVKGGYSQETREQAHLSHVIEHMAFTNRTIDPNRADKSVLEDLGFDPGAVNGITDFQRTSYLINMDEIDTIRLNASLTILRAWCNEITMDSGHVNLDRTSVLNELISMSGGSERPFWASFYHSNTPFKFSELIPHVKTVDYRNAGQLYRSMYQPDRQALFIAGNWKAVPALEKKLEVLFGSLPASTVLTHPAAKATPVKGVFWELRNETNYPMFRVEYKLPDRPVRNAAGLKSRLIAELVAELGKARFTYLNELHPEILNNYFEYKRIPMAGDVLGVFGGDMFMLADVTKTSYDTIIADYLTIQRQFLGGSFSKQEIINAKEKIRKKYASQLLAGNREWVLALEDSYIENESLLGMAVLKTMLPLVIESITLKDLQQTVRQLRLTKDVSYIFGHIDSTIGFALSKEEFFSLQEKINKSKELTIRPAMKKNVPVFFADSLQHIQVIKRERENGATVLSLSNGNRVVLKMLLSKNVSSDYVEVDAISPGGLNVLTESEKKFAHRLTGAMEQSVQQGISREDLQAFNRKLNLTVNTILEKDYSVITGSTTPSNADWLVKMVIDRLYHAQLDRKGLLLSSNENACPGKKRSALDSLVSLVLVGDPAINRTNNADLSAELKELQRINRKLFPPAAPYTIVITGDFDSTQVEKLVLGRFGPIKISSMDHTAAIPGDLNLPLGSTEISQMIQGGKSRGVNLWFYTKLTPGLETTTKLKLLGSIFDSYLFNRIRNELGEVYAISAMVHQTSDSVHALYVSAPTETVTAGHLYNSLDDAIQKFLADGINDTTLTIAKARMVRKIELDQHQRRFWNNYYLEDVLKNGKAPGLAERIQAVQSVQVEELRKLARQFLVPNMEFVDDQPN